MKSLEEYFIIDCLSWERLVLFDDIHHSISEICHILSNKETQMASSNLFISNKRLDLISCPLGICSVSKNIGCTSKDGYWNLVNSIDWDQVSMLLLIVIEDVSVLICPELETVFSNVLCIMKHRFNRCSIWFMGHIYCVSIIIIQGWIT